MDLKLVSKNNIGVIATLILIILLSHSNFFNFLIDTPLGRAFLIIIIIVISFVNKILGVVSVLFIIILFNQSNIAISEGFTSTYGKQQHKINKLNHDQGQHSASKMADITSALTTTSVINKPSTGIEGFNTVDREGTILRGKRSSEMPVLINARNQSDNIQSTDSSVFTNNYSFF